jgi:hypothetical protein
MRAQRRGRERERERERAEEESMMDPRVLDAMLPIMTREYGNHHLGERGDR